MGDLENKLSRVKELSIPDLKNLCDNIREFLIISNSKTGGHIGANLGVVELSIALHRVFESPSDGFIFDIDISVIHTSY